MKRRKVMGLLLTLCMVVGMVACGDSPAGNESSSSGNESSAENENEDLSQEEGNIGGDETDEKIVLNQGDEKPYEGMHLVIGYAYDLIASESKKAYGALDSYYIMYLAIEEWCAKNGCTWESQEGNTIESIAAGRPQDLAICGGLFPELPTIDAAEPITEYYDYFIDKYGTDLTNKAVAGIFKEELYGFSLPQDFASNYIMYDREFFKEKGVKTPGEYLVEGNWTWDTFKTVCDEITEDEDGDGVNDVVGFCLTNSPSMGMAISLDEETGEYVSNMESDNIRKIAQIVYEGYTLNGTMVTAPISGPPTTVNGQYIAMTNVYNSGPDFMALVSNAKAGVRAIEYVPYPADDESEKFITTNGSIMMVPKGAQNKEASVALMDYLISVQLMFQNKMAVIPDEDMDYDYLYGLTERGKIHVERIDERREREIPRIFGEFGFDEAYIKAIENVKNNYPRRLVATLPTSTEVSGNLTGNISVFTQPPATALAELIPLYESMVEEFNDTYIR